jgi:hypothetical protein
MNGPNAKERDYCKRGHDDDLIVRTLLKRELINKNNIEHIIDVDDDNYFNKNDVDLILCSKKCDITTVEIKADGYKKINNIKYVFLELISNSVKYQKSEGQDGLGCCLTSNSKNFIFYFTQYDQYLIVKTNKLREFIRNNKNNYEHKQAKTWAPDNSRIWYYSEGIIVPVPDLINLAGGILKDSNIKYLDIKNELGL